MEIWLNQMLQWLALPEHGLSTVFVVAFVSATLLPMGSEPAVFGLVKLNPDLFWAAAAVCCASAPTTAATWPASELRFSVAVMMSTVPLEFVAVQAEAHTGNDGEEMEVLGLILPDGSAAIALVEDVDLVDDTDPTWRDLVAAAVDLDQADED